MKCGHCASVGQGVNETTRCDVDDIQSPTHARMRVCAQVEMAEECKRLEMPQAHNFYNLQNYYCEHNRTRSVHVYHRRRASNTFVQFENVG